MLTCQLSEGYGNRSLHVAVNGSRSVRSSVSYAGPRITSVSCIDDSGAEMLSCHGGHILLVEVRYRYYQVDKS